MTYLGHTVTLTWCDLWSNFKIDLSRIKFFAKNAKNDPKTVFETSKSVKIKFGKSRFCPEIRWKLESDCFDMFYVISQPFLKVLT